ncbi:S-layer homology domain-containing protein [Domibacillus sp. PGB-M46]|uniref:S-layer homology domain-containing protein n=1 Tax=Domibacillus sp. PGB-M46 TaxID=2910255 RepID=UPI001F5AB2E3|nr:S-layer homology domain-containing protein [Domibacillus sp. PGB-M46]MCI2253119.1 S-layer homology domain-containing protein [Domibacillus sp. PGB-M46]
MTLRKKLAVTTLTPVLAASIFASSVSAAHFPDVKSSHRAYEAIEAMSEAKVITGFPDGTFKQYQAVTRAESAILIGRALGVTVGTSTKTYTDLPKTSKAYPYVAKLMELGVFGENSRFYPDRPLSRSEMAIILTRAFDLPASADMPFTDVSPAHGAASYIRALAAAGITTGIGDGKYDPSGIVTRGQMAIFLDNALNYEPGTGEPTPEPEPTPDPKPTPDPDPVDVAAIEAPYAAEFAALQSSAVSKLNSLASQAKAELDAGAELSVVAPKYMGLAASLEAETDASFNEIYGRLTADLAANGYSTQSAEKYRTQYEAAKAKWQSDLIARFL